MDVVDQKKPCSRCKHFVYDAKAAHQNRCSKFANGAPSIAVALVRVKAGPCQKGKGWEKRK